MSASTSAVEACIVAYDSAAVIRAAITSLTLVPGCSVAVCDNSPHGSSLQAAEDAAASAGLPLRTLVAPHNPGFGAACNLLARTSRAEWLMFLNPDAAILDWPWESSGLPRAHLVGAEQVTSAGRPLGAHGTTYGVGEEIRRSWLRRPSRRPEGSGFVGGGAMMIERERFIELGGFDERYFLFYEDIDLSFRAAAAGLRVTVDRGWRVRHDLGHSARRHLDTALLASYRSGRLFHAELGHNLRAYDTYVAVDAVARWIRMAAKRDRSGRGAYSKVFGEASRHLLERSVVAGR